MALMVWGLGPLLRSGPPLPNLLSQGLGLVFALATMGVVPPPQSQPLCPLTPIAYENLRAGCLRSP